MAPRRLGDVLVDNGALTQGELQRYLAIQAGDPPNRRRRLGRILLEDERVTEITLAMALAECNDLEFVDLSLEKIDGELARSIPKLIAQRGLVLPLATDGKKLRVAAADPRPATAGRGRTRVADPAQARLGLERGVNGRGAELGHPGRGDRTH